MLPAGGIFCTSTFATPNPLTLPTTGARLKLRIFISLLTEKDLRGWSGREKLEFESPTLQPPMTHHSTAQPNSPPPHPADERIQLSEVKFLPAPPAVEPGAPLSFPGEDRGYPLAEMAQRDLDAALQLLAERAQYITGATGAAIALRHVPAIHDMLCRATAGPNAPELGALLSTEFGLSGESVRTQQSLRCDNAETRWPREPRKSAYDLGIASVPRHSPC